MRLLALLALLTCAACDDVAVPEPEYMTVLVEDLGGTD